MHKHRVINGFDSFEVFIIAVMIGVCLAMALVGLAASVAEAAPRDGHRNLVIQCSITKKGNADDCTSFVIPAHPKVGELGEATATHPYTVEWCDLSRRGFANNCEVQFVPKGDQIIAPERN